MSENPSDGPPRPSSSTNHSKLRRQIAYQAARLMCRRQETEYYQAKMKAARRICRGWVKPADLPGNAEIRDEIQRMANLAYHVFKSNVAGKAVRRPVAAEPEPFPAREHPDVDPAEATPPVEDRPDCFDVYRWLLLPLENVCESRRYHPESDALYHSLQVFDLARNELPCDEEFLVAALMHDVGKAIDPCDHTAAGLEALDGFITERTAWLVEHHVEARQILDRTIGARACRRLQRSGSYDELVLLARCDRDGRQVGADAPELDEALDYLRQLSAMCGG